MSQPAIAYPANLRFPMERANAIQSVRTCHALAERGVRVHLIVRRTSGETDREVLEFYGAAAHPNLVIHRIPVLGKRWPARVRNPLFSLAALDRVWGLWRRGAIDAVYLRDIQIARALLSLRRFFPIGVFLELHHINRLFLEERADLYDNVAEVSASELERQAQIERRLISEAQGVVVVSERLRMHVEKTFPEAAPIRVIPNGVSLPLEAPRPVGEREGMTALYVGQLYRWKGIDTLLEAASHLRTPGATIEIVGGLPYESDLERLRAEARRLGVEDRVRFSGFVPPAGVQSVLARARVGTLPLPASLYASEFTCPMKLLEYMAAGLPVVASDVPSVRQFVRHGESGFLVPPGDAKALAEAIDRLFEDASLAERIAAAAFADARAYSWSRRAEQIAEFIFGGNGGAGR